MGLVLEFEMWRYFDVEQKSKSITSETEEQLKTLLRLKEMGTLPEDVWKEKVKQLIS